MPDPSIVEEYVLSLYRLLLKREPDELGWQSWCSFMNNAGPDGFKDVLAHVVNSDEYKSLYSVSGRDNDLERFKAFDFDALDTQTLCALFERTATYWRGAGSDPKELYWSVLSHDAFRGHLSHETIQNFLASGKYDVDKMIKIFDFLGLRFDDCREYLEFGCGVGRLVVNLPSSIQTINCVDFSSAHLREAEHNIKRQGLRGNYLFHGIDSFLDLHKLPKNQDIIHSFIVLQHNTPPIIEKTIQILLGLLSVGGLAILHVPIAKASYRFDVEEYLHAQNSGQSMEMHILPKANLYKLAKKSGCNIVYSFCDGGCGGDIYSEIVVFQRQQ
ncbi:MAG: methyltransferase domain-containing protein [Cyanobacteriota bacterium]